VTRDSDATDWEPTTQQRTDGGFRRAEVYSAPFTNFAQSVQQSTPNKTILSRLVAGNDRAVEGHWNGTSYDNADVAELYVLPDFSKFANALQSVALAQCGGTLSVSTRLDGVGPAPDPFTYQNSRIADSSGAVLDVEPSVITTNRTTPVGTFDFSIPGGEDVTVDIVPHNLSDLTGYSPAGWSCKAGIEDRPFQLIDLPDSDWTGVRLTVSSNEAVSCVMHVTR
jgi:hypothetical protein